MKLFRATPYELLVEGELIQFFAVHVLAWERDISSRGIEPTYAFVEDDTLEKQKDELADHLLKVMEVAVDNMSYAPSSDAAGEQFDTIVAARDYMIEQGIAKER